VARRSRTVDAPPDRVWEVVSDPDHMPRWWPRVARVEGVDEDRFTEVLTTRKGRVVRMDFRLLESSPPGAGGEPSGRRRWEQELEGTPFERVFSESRTEILLEPAGERTLVTIALSHKLSGYSRTGGFLLRRANRATLREALEGLAEIVTTR
jgi:carbon monoxide dehydrogenase subunit G